MYLVAGTEKWQEENSCNIQFPSIFLLTTIISSSNYLHRDKYVTSIYNRPKLTRSTIWKKKKKNDMYGLKNEKKKIFPCALGRVLGCTQLYYNSGKSKGRDQEMETKRGGNSEKKARREFLLLFRVG